MLNITDDVASCKLKTKLIYLNCKSCSEVKDIDRTDCLFLGGVNILCMISLCACKPQDFCCSRVTPAQSSAALSVFQIPLSELFEQLVLCMCMYTCIQRWEG